VRRDRLRRRPAASRLARDVEIAVLHFRGSARLAAAGGPLREPPRRLKSVDAVVLNGEVPPLRVTPGVHDERRTRRVYSVADPGRRASLSALVEEQQRTGTRVVAAAGIAAPERFFAMLRAAGLTIEECRSRTTMIRRQPLLRPRYDVALVTERTRKMPRQRRHEDRRPPCAVSLRTRIEPALIDLIEAKIEPNRQSDERANDGPSPA